WSQDTPSRRCAQTLDGSRQVDELPLELEALGELLRQRLDAELLGRVVPRGDEGDGELARVVQGRLGGLARQVQVVALGRGVREVTRRAAGKDRDARKVGRPFREDERLRVDPFADPRDEVLERRGDSAADSPVEEPAVDLDAELAREQRV